LRELLADAKADPDIRHIIVQGHTPILQPILNTGSSGMTHDIAAPVDQGVQQINHGSPLPAAELSTTSLAP
jgi:hypothetical protein